uniref:Uncharacterized protein n=1 Tax=Pseudomonas aeruginosa TaxID=287 RepID=A0A6H1Q9S1_PSEAI|nr:Hypothetical protein [Pseudomonas aeruginosa]
MIDAIRSARKSNSTVSCLKQRSSRLTSVRLRAMCWPKSRCRSADPSACRSVSDRGRCRRQPRAWHLFLQCQRSVATWPPVWKRRYRTMLSWRLLSVFRLLSLRRPLLSHEATEAACETIFMAASASVRRLRSIAGRKLLLARVRSEKPA